MQSFTRAFGRSWVHAMNLLLTGSGYRLVNSSDVEVGAVLALDENSFREFSKGDYHLLHTDALDSRTLTINYWLATPEWKLEWGGHLLWCGLPKYAFDSNLPPTFPDA